MFVKKTSIIAFSKRIYQRFLLNLMPSPFFLIFKAGLVETTDPTLFGNFSSLEISSLEITYLFK